MGHEEGGALAHELLAGSLTLYMTFLNTILVLLAVVYTNVVTNGCTALYCACTYQYHIHYLYFDMDFSLALKFR